MRRRLREAGEFLAEVVHRCVRHSIDSQSAALAFYTLFALAPVLLLVGSVASSIFGQARVHAELLRQSEAVLGREAGAGVAAVLEKAAGEGVGADLGGVAATVAFFLGATAVFIQLHEALNLVWEVAPRPRKLWRTLLARRLLSLALVLAVGVVLLVSLALSAGLLVVTDAVTARIPLSAAAVALANEVLSLLVFTVLVALIFRTLPDAKLAWRDVTKGAVVTSLLFAIGRWGIGLYLGRTTVASRFGVAGSLVVILLWVYYVSYIVLFGAELTAVASDRSGGARGTPIADPASSRKEAPCSGHSS